jgi:hypothetical protein
MPVEIKMKTNAGNNDQFFMQMLPASHQQDYKVVSAKGVKFNLAFYSVTADLSALGHPNVSVTLPTSTTSLMKGNADQLVQQASIVQLIALLDKVKSAVFDTKIGPLENVTEKTGHMEAKSPNLQSTPKMQPMKDGTGLIRLTQATEVGQPVRGSSGGSVYYAMALSERVKLAIRVKKNGSISIRAEGSLSAADEAKLAKAGMSKAGAEHWSIHFDAIDVPIPRCIGAFLMGLEIPFDSQIMNFSQVTVEA